MKVWPHWPTGNSFCWFFPQTKNVDVFKGTVRPDWIYMRVVPLDRPCKEHQTL